MFEIGAVFDISLFEAGLHGGSLVLSTESMTWFVYYYSVLINFT